MSKGDDLKDRLEEMFSSLPDADHSTELDKRSSIFQTAFVRSPVGICLTDTKGNFIQANPAFGQMLGYKAEVLQSKSFQSITYADDLSVGADALRAMLNGEGNTAHIQKRYLHQDGHIVWVDLNITLIQDEESKPLYFFTIAQEMTEQKRTAVLLDKRVRELNCLSDIGHKIDERPELPEFLEWITERIPQAMQYPDVCVAAIEYAQHVYGNIKALELETKMVGGLRIGGELIGWLHIAYLEPREFIDAESALIGAIVSRLDSYIETSQLLEEASHRSKELTVLNDLGRAMTSSILEQQAVLENVYQYTGRLMDVENFYIALYDEETQFLSYPIALSEGQVVEIAPHQLGAGGLTDYIIHSGQPLLLGDRVSEKMDEIGIQFISYGDEQAPVSWLGVPMIYQERVLGVISVQTVITPGLYTEYDQEVLVAIASQAANALAASQQYEQMQKALHETQLVSAEFDRQSQTLQTVLDNLPSGVFVAEAPSGKSLLANKTAIELLGKGIDPTAAAEERADIYPAYIYGTDTLYPPENIPLVRGMLGESSSVEDMEIRRPDGSSVLLQVLGAPVRDASGQVTSGVAILNDITERKAAETTLKRRANELEAVAQVSTDVASILDPQELLQNVVNLTKDRFSLYHAHIYLLDDAKKNLVLSAGTGEVGAKMVAQGWAIPLDRQQSLVARSARQRQGMIVNNVQSDSNFLPNEMLPETASEMAVPILAGNELLGVLDVQSDQADHFTQQDITIQTTLASQIAVALQNSRLYYRTQRALTEAEALYAGSAVIANATNIEKILQGLIASTSLNKLERANFMVFDRTWDDTMPDWLTVTAVWERSGEPSRAPVGTTYPLKGFPAFHFLDRDKPVIVADVDNDKRIDPGLRKAFQQVGMRSLVAFPLRVGTQWFGIVTGQASTPFYLTNDEVRRINNLISQAATVAQNLRLIEQTQTVLT